MRWALFIPAGVAAYLAVVILAVVAHLTSGRESADSIPALLTNAMAAGVSTFVAAVVAPRYRRRVATGWTVVMFLIACYGNFIASFVSWSRSSGNVVMISLGAIAGYLVSTRILVEEETSPNRSLQTNAGDRA